MWGRWTLLRLNVISQYRDQNAQDMTREHDSSSIIERKSVNMSSLEMEYKINLNPKNIF